MDLSIEISFLNKKRDLLTKKQVSFFVLLNSMEHGKMISSENKAKKPSAVIDGNNIYILQSGVNIYIKTAELCSLIGKSNVWVGQLTNQGSIFKTQTPKGNMYHLEDTIKRYCEILEKRGKTITESDAQIDKAKRAAEARLKEAKAVVAELVAQELEGKVILAEDVEALTSALVFSVKSALLSLPGRLAINVAKVQTAAEASDLIRKEVEEILKILAAQSFDINVYKNLARDREGLQEEALSETDD